MITLVPGGMGGTETYARELLSGLVSQPDLDVAAYVPASARHFPPRGARTVVAEQVPGGGSTRERVQTALIGELARRAIARSLAGADLVHYPFTALVPRPLPGTRFVQTLHDVQHLDLPDLFSSAELAYRRMTYERAARRADRVITITEFSRRQIQHHLGIPDEQISVVPLGVDTSSFTPNLGDREDFVLYPARGWPHKNHAALIEAMALVRETEPEMRLVLTGGGLEDLGDVPEWVEVRGLVPLEDLRSLYRRAAVMAFPSRYEGFGLPPLEAMASGCPVAASNAAALPEVCGDAAVLFDPDDPTDIARGILAARTAGEDLTRRGLARAHEFTWRRCVAGHVAVYREVAAA